MNSLKLRQGRVLLRMFEELPPPAPGEPARDGQELLDLYNELHYDDEEFYPDEPPPQPAPT